MQRFRRYRGISGLVETTVNRALLPPRRHAEESIARPGLRHARDRSHRLAIARTLPESC
jgi:hypothetical protein